MHCSLDYALCELHKRRQDPALLMKIEQTVQIPAPLCNNPHLVLGRPIATPNFETAAFIDLANRAGLNALVLENTGDRIIAQAHNEDKRTLLQLPVQRCDDQRRKDQLKKFWLADMNKVNGKVLGDICTWDGTPLKDFHHRLFEEEYPNAAWWDARDWVKNHGGTAKHYYASYLTLFLAHGILCETFVSDKKEGPFLDAIVIPAIDAIRQKFNLEPLIVSAIPEEQVRETKWTSYAKKFERAIMNAAKR